MKQTMFNRQPLLLVVDDMPDNLELLARMFKEEGYQVRLAPSGALALKAVQVQAPDLILLDINMPGMNGFEATEKITAICPQTKIAFLTGNIQDSSKSRAEKMGHGFVEKPVTAESFAKLKAFMGQ